MTRRELLAIAAAPLAAAQAPPNPNESVLATATQDKTPRVGIVLSSFKGGAEHDGTPVKGLASPQPLNASLSQEQISAWLFKALELGAPLTGGINKIVAADDWVVIKPDIASCPGSEPKFVPGLVTDLRLVKALIEYLVEHKAGARITVAEGSGGWKAMERGGGATDGWTTDWNGAFGGLSYKKMIADFAKRFPSRKFDYIDLNFEDPIELPVPGKAMASKNPDGVYYIPKTITQCDKLISMSPLKTNFATGVSLAMKNYFGIGPGAKYGWPKLGLRKLGDPNEVLVDLFSFHPADYAIVGGCFGAEADAEMVHHNLLIAGANALAVDATGAAAMGFDPAKLPFLKLAWSRGFGTYEADSIWTRGNETEEARRRFRPATEAPDAA